MVATDNRRENTIRRTPKAGVKKLEANGNAEVAAALELLKINRGKESTKIHKTLTSKTECAP